VPALHRDDDQQTTGAVRYSLRRLHPLASSRVPIIGLPADFASAPEPAKLRPRADLSQLAGAGDSMASPNKYG